MDLFGRWAVRQRIVSLLLCLLYGFPALVFDYPSQLYAQNLRNRVIKSIYSRDTSEGTLVTFYESPLSTFVTRQNDNRFLLIIPRAGNSVTPGYIYSSSSLIVQADRKENDAIFSFDLRQGATVAVKQYTDKLDVLITRPEGKVNSIAGKTETPVIKPAENKIAAPLKNPEVTKVETPIKNSEEGGKAVSHPANPSVSETTRAILNPAALEKQITPEIIKNNNDNALPQTATPPSNSSRGNTARAGRRGSLKGQVVDVNNALILGASVNLVDESGTQKTFVTNSRGEFSFSNLEPGTYSLIATANGFEPVEMTQVTIGSGEAERLDLKMDVGKTKAEVTVAAESPLKSGLTTRILRGKDLEMLPNTPGGLSAALRALAVRSGGARGPQIIVDGFSGGRLPPKESIREIRINDNPFSAEYSEMGLARVEIFTKPGSEKFQVSGFFNFNDESLNTRNPFSLSRTSFQSRLYGATISGPIVSKRGSFFFDFERQEIDDNALINATILDPSFNIISFNRSLVVPERRMTFSPRFDFQLNQKNTLVGRYSYTRRKSVGEKIGDFSLPERGISAFDRENILQLTETAIIETDVINETRFQFGKRSNRKQGTSSLPVINVADAFVGGGSDFDLMLRDEKFLELHNYTTLTRGNHDLKFGGKFRRIQLGEYSSENFNGTFTFSGGIAPQIDAAGRPVIDPATGRPLLTSITGIERYRRTLYLRGLGLSLEDVRALGGGATQFSIAAGEPESSVSQSDGGVFVQDDWRLRPNFTLSAGLRIEAQNNIGRNPNFAPRISFAWSPDGKNSDPKTVIRGGFGLFYDRFGEDYTLEARRFNGLSQQQFIVSDPAILDFFPMSPSAASLVAFAISQTIKQVAKDLRAPYSTQISLSLERQLPKNFSVAATFINTNSFHLLRSRNINAPLEPGNPNSRPIPDAGEIFQYESSGRFTQNQLILNTAYNGEKLNFYATYMLTRAKGNTEGAESFPAYQYNLNGEFGRSELDIRHQLYLGGWIAAPWKIYLNPLIFYRSGTPFNITIGRDINSDSLFTERPAFAADPSRASVVRTPYGAFDLDPLPGQQIIPRNYGRGPGFFSVNLGINRTFTFFGEESGSQDAPVGSRRPLSITFSVNIENLLNRTNAGLPVGNLSSPLFGRSFVSAGAYGLGSNPGGNRRIEIQVSFKY